MEEALILIEKRKEYDKNKKKKKKKIMTIEKKIKELGLSLPQATDPVGSYVATKISGKFLFISGQISINDKREL